MAHSFDPYNPYTHCPGSFGKGIINLETFVANLHAHIAIQADAFTQLMPLPKELPVLTRRDQIDMAKKKKEKEEEEEEAPEDRKESGAEKGKGKARGKPAAAKAKPKAKAKAKAKLSPKVKCTPKRRAAVKKVASGSSKQDKHADAGARRRGRAKRNLSQEFDEAAEEPKGEGEGGRSHHILDDLVARLDQKASRKAKAKPKAQGKAKAAKAKAAKAKPSKRAKQQVEEQDPITAFDLVDDYLHNAIVSGIPHQVKDMPLQDLKAFLVANGPFKGSERVSLSTYWGRCAVGLKWMVLPSTPQVAYFALKGRSDAGQDWNRRMAVNYLAASLFVACLGLFAKNDLG